MTKIDDRLAGLEARLCAAEDELAVIRLVASYGPLVDCGSTGLAPALFGEDGVYDVSYGRMTGQDAVSTLLLHADHQDALKKGIAHVMGLPWVRIDGDCATAINCTQLYLRDGDGYTIFRIAQNIWKLQREKQGWRVTERINRLIGGDGEARALLGRAIEAI